MTQKGLLALSYAFPSLMYPRSVQVHRLLTHLKTPVHLVSAENPKDLNDFSIAPYPLPEHLCISRISYAPPTPHSLLKALKLSVFQQSLPDPQNAWSKKAERELFSVYSRSPEKWGGILSFAQPFSDHLACAKLSKKTGLPLILHFSDPWTQNPFRHSSRIIQYAHQYWENKVLNQAQLVLFTSDETRALYLKSNPTSLHSKMKVLPHTFDSSRYLDIQKEPIYTIRSLGSFYGPRSPEPLMAVINSIATENPELLKNVQIQLIGQTGNLSGIFSRYPLSQRFISALPQVPYQESLNLMKTAHCLLNMDAPADHSVFFPSKLADYFGAKSFVVAISPDGAASRLVLDAGGLAANPDNSLEIKSVLEKVLIERPYQLPIPPDLEASTIAQIFEAMIQSVLN